jgi:hypothetical protein
LDVEAFDRSDRRPDKLRDDGDLLGSVDDEPGTEERRVSHAVGVEVAAGLVTSTCCAVEIIVSMCTRLCEGPVHVWCRTGGPGASTLAESG